MVRKNASVRETLRGIVMVTAVSALVLACTAFVMLDLVTFRRTLQHDGITLGDEVIGTIYIASDLRDIGGRITRYIIVADGILFLAILMAFAISRLLESVLSAPILQLADVVERVRSKRDYVLRTPVDDGPPRETHDLMFAGNDMLEEIQRRDEELRLHREHLKEQVAARTFELRAANAELVESKNAAERIAEVNESLSRHRQAILDAAAEGIFGLDSDGKATFINMAAARLLGVYAWNLAGKRLHDVIHPDGESELEWRACDVCSPFLDPPLRSGRTAMFRASDGRHFPVEYTASTMHSQGVVGLVVTFRDITERLAVERLKDEFVSTVSHELRTPLTSIRGALGLLGSGLLGSVGERAKRMLDIAVSNTDRLVRMINDVLDLERISSGGVQLNRKVTSAADLTREAIEVIQPFADRASVRIEDSVDHTLLWVDCDRIVQTLTNLLGNAIKFSPAGSVVQLRGTLTSETFTFGVSDCGRGIPSEKIESIFGRFQQVDASDSRDRGGSGLGLAISRSIVSAHGGCIWAESTVGEGSTFFFTVPAAVRRATSPGAEGAGAVLVCAEDGAMAASVVQMLESRGHRAFAIGGVEPLLEQAISARPAAIVRICSSPPVKCCTLKERLRSAQETSSVPLIIASENPPAQFESAEDPITAWVRMPFSGADLTDALAVAWRNA